MGMELPLIERQKKLARFPGRYFLTDPIPFCRFRKDHRHSLPGVVDRFHQGIGPGGNDGKSIDIFSCFLIRPAVAKSRKNKWSVIFKPDEPWYLFSLPVLPFEKTVCNDQTSSLLKGFSECGFLMNCFSAGVVGPFSDLFCFLAVRGPAGYQPPSHQDGPAGFLLCDNRYQRI